MDPATLRGLERILAVAVGGLAICLGYLLFLHIPHERDGEGKVVLPGGISIFVTRVGPGVFFALFGTVVVGLSFAYAIRYASESPPIAPAPVAAERAPAGRVRYSGAAPPLGASPARTPLDIKLDIEFLNSLPRYLKADLPRAQRTDLDVRAREMKLALIESVWPDEWGDLGAFRRWVQAGGADPVPREVSAEAAALYRHGR